MYKKRRKANTYPRNQIAGFWTDSLGRRRPRTLRKGRASLPKLHLPMTAQLPKPLAETVVSSVLSQTPIIKEICAAYSLADSLYDNWNTITQLYDEYKKKGTQGIAKKIETEAVHNVLSSIQTDAVWTIVDRFIPKDYKETGKGILANFMGTITTAEIALAKQVLQQKV